MNLAVTPVKFNNYSATQNCKNNNSQQDFGAGLQAKLLTHSTETAKDVINTRTVQHRDMIIDRVMHSLEETAKKIGLNTDKLDQQGVIAEFHPIEHFSTRMNVFLKDKKGNVIQNEGRPIFAQVRRGNEMDQGENLAHDLKGLNLNTNA